MSIRAARIVSWGIWTLAVVLALGFMVFSALNRGVEAAGGFGPVPDILFGLLLIGFVTVGALVSSRRPGNPVGWIITGVGLSLVLTTFTESYGVYALFTNPGSLPGVKVMAWISAWIGIPSVFAAPALLFLLFPDGRLVNRRWRVVLWLVVAATLSAMTDVVLSPVLDDAPFKGVTNPLGIDAPDTLLEMLGNFGWPGMTAGLLASAVAMIVRLSRSSGIERQQLKWIATAAAILPLASAVGVASYYLGWEGAGTALTILASLLVPLAAGYAVFRYRLYDIDVVINRTLVYGLLTASLALVYFGGVAGLQRLLAPVTGENGQLAVVAVTLAIAALFNPLRWRIQRFIDRLFYRNKYDAAKTLETFSATLRDETDLEALGDGLVSVTRETVRPAHVSLWLRETGERR